MDLNTDKNKLPEFNGRVFMKVTRISWDNSYWWIILDKTSVYNDSFIKEDTNQKNEVDKNGHDKEVEKDKFEENFEFKEMKETSSSILNKGFSNANNGSSSFKDDNFIQFEQNPKINNEKKQADNLLEF